LFIERADQTSRLLDVQFAQRATGMETSPEQAAGLWNALLRSASAYHAYRRAHASGLDPAAVARFLIFDNRLPRSIAFCAGEIQRMVTQLRGEFRLRNAQRAFERVETFLGDLQNARRDEGLLTRLHQFNDWVQSELMALTAELGNAFFGHQKMVVAGADQPYAKAAADAPPPKLAQSPLDMPASQQSQQGQ
jgi:uncharacterized alpha-E superfamily protein